MLPLTPEGLFRFDGLIPGSFDLVAQASGHRIGVLRGIALEAGVETGDLVVVLEPGASLRIHNRGTKNVRYFVRSGGVTIAYDGIPAGGMANSTVPAGRHQVEILFGEQKLETKDVEIGKGEQQEIVFEGVQ
jgi:hypothetical protein